MIGLAMMEIVGHHISIQTVIRGLSTGSQTRRGKQQTRRTPHDQAGLLVALPPIVLPRMLISSSLNHDLQSLTATASRSPSPPPHQPGRSSPILLNTGKGVEGEGHTVATPLKKWGLEEPHSGCWSSSTCTKVSWSPARSSEAPETLVESFAPDDCGPAFLLSDRQPHFGSLPAILFPAGWIAD